MVGDDLTGGGINDLQPATRLSHLSGHVAFDIECLDRVWAALYDQGPRPGGIGIADSSIEAAFMPPDDALLQARMLVELMASLPDSVSEQGRVLVTRRPSQSLPSSGRSAPGRRMVQGAE